MNSLILNIFTLFLLSGNSLAANWAFLVAGSAGYYNYRHQADIAHANYYLHQANFDMDKVIVMSFDDVPRSQLNPFYNDLINMPDGPNKYKHIRIDYSKYDVNPSTFYAVLDGNISTLRTIGTGRYLDVDKDDTVLLYMTDHGASQIFAMIDDDIEANDLVNALKRLKGRCKKILVAVEACESGSLFLNLLNSTDEGILAVTASNEVQSSYANYPDDKRETFLGDEFSTAFLEALDRADQKDERLKTIFEIVKLETLNSPVQIFGDERILNDTIATFIPFNARPNTRRRFSTDNPKKNPLQSNLVQLELAKRTLKKFPDNEYSLFIVKHSKIITDVFYNFKKTMALKGIDIDNFPTGYKSDYAFQCYRDVRKHLYSIYSPASRVDATLPFLRYLNSACRADITTEEIKKALELELLVYTM